MASISRMLGSIFLFAAVIVDSQSQSSVDPNALMSLAAKRIEASVDRQRRFACDATIAREFYRTDSSGSEKSVGAIGVGQQRSLLSRDRLRVDVAVFDGRQFFSWPGTDVFRFEGLDEMTGGGASGTGDFGPFAASFLADSDPASVRFRGVGEWAGRRVAEYTYDVPLVSSHYEVETGPDRFERTAYEGSMFVDVRTGDLYRLTIRVPWPPPGSGVLRAEVDTTYQPQGGGEGPDLFPSASTLTMTLVGGGEAINRTTYRACHVFSSESTIRFETSSVAEKEPEKPAVQSRLPAGLEVRSTPLTRIDSRTAVAGDLFEARVVEPVRQEKQVVVPKGAVLHGRIVEVEQRYYPRVSVRLMLKFDYVEFDGKSVPIALAARATIPPPSPLSPYAPADRRIVQPEVPGEAEDQSGHIATIWVFGKDRVHFDTHTLMLWETR
jgi:hypothetical protein